MLNIEYDKERKLIFFVEKNIAVEGQHIIRGISPEAEEITNFLFFTEQNPNVVKEFIINQSPWEMYYYVKGVGITPSIKSQSLPALSPQEPGRVIIATDPPNLFFGMAFYQDEQLLYTYNGTKREIQQYQVSTGDLVKSFFQNVGASFYPVERMALDKVNQKLFWIEVFNEILLLRGADLNGVQPVIHYNEAIGRKFLQIGRFN